jgi:HEXXH motif-containing protein
MTLNHAWFRHFGCPDEAGDLRTMDAIAVPHAAAVAFRLALMLSDDTSADLADFLTSWSETAMQTACFDDVWDLAFGHAQWSLSHTAACRDAAIRLSLRLTKIGHFGVWSADSDGLVGLRLGNRLLPKTSRIELRAGSAAAELVLEQPDGGRLVALREGNGIWHVPGGMALPAFPAGADRGSIRLLPRPALPDAEGTSFDGVELFPTVDATMATNLAAGASVLGARAPVMLDWALRVLRGIAPCRSAAEFRAISGSGEHTPGIIHVSYPLGRFDVAEILLHEAAHQYFYLLERLGPLEDGSDTRLHWSPPIRRARPLSRILMAYHALANVRLFYETCRDTGAEAKGYLDHNLQPIDEAVAKLDAPLRDSTALTTLGRVLYETLHKRIAVLA